MRNAPPPEKTARGKNATSHCTEDSSLALRAPATTPTRVGTRSIAATPRTLTRSVNAGRAAFLSGCRYHHIRIQYPTTSRPMIPLEYWTCLEQEDFIGWAGSWEEVLMIAKKPDDRRRLFRRF